MAVQCMSAPSKSWKDEGLDWLAKTRCQMMFFTGESCPRRKITALPLDQHVLQQTRSVRSGVSRDIARISKFGVVERLLRYDVSVGFSSFSRSFLLSIIDKAIFIWPLNLPFSLELLNKAYFTCVNLLIVKASE
jgi:hypothetical protein